MRCPECGNEKNREGARFCDDCGTPLSSSPPEAADSPSPETEPPAGPAPAATGDLPERLTPLPGDAPERVGEGRFELIGLLGEGSRKRVYVARDHDHDGRLVAVAVFNTERLAAMAQARSRREADAVEQLGSHPRVVGVLASGQDGDRPFIASEYMAGGDLCDLLDGTPGRRLPVQRALAIAAEIAAGLEHAHGKGIVHRDIKPANVWFDADGSSRLGDFGLAISTARSREAIERMVVGTAAYLPPEQAIGGRTDARADLYSLGALLYEMLAGEPPFPGEDPVSIISRHLSAEPLPPSRHNPEVSAGVDGLVKRLLAKAPEQRPESAAVVVRELGELSAELEAGPGPGEATAPAGSENPLDDLAGGVFVGREAELGELRDLAETAFAGRGGVALVEGEPGIGKTRLLEELITYGRVRGATVLSSACHEADAVPAYWPFAQLIRSFVRDADPVGLGWQLGADGPEIARLVPEVRELVPAIGPPPAIESDDARFRFYEAVATLLTGIADTRPLLLVIDDLHWADSSSIELLRFLGRRLSGSPLLLACAYRDEEAEGRGNLRRALGELDQAPRRLRLLLRGLGPEAIGRFIEQTTGRPPAPELLAEVSDQTGGNPFFVGEVVRLIATERGGAGRGVAVVPEGVREAVSRRLERLEPGVREALVAASVIGRELDPALLDELVDGSASGYLEAAHAARIVEPRQRRGIDGRALYFFSHAVFREALYSELEPSRRADLHRRCGEAIERLWAGSAEQQVHALARHFIEAGPEAGGERALEYSLAAGREAAGRLAHADAAEHLERALEALPSGRGPEELKLRLELAEEMTRSGRFRDARRLLLETAGAARLQIDLETEVEIVIALAALSEVGSTDQELVSFAEGVLSRLGDGDPARRSLVLSALATEYFWGAAATLYREAGDRALALAREAGEDRALASALAVAQVLLIGRPGKIPEREGMVAEMLVAARRCGDRTNEARALAQQVVIALQRGDSDGADRAIADYERLARFLSEPRHLWHVPVMRACRETMRGHFETARELSAEGARLGELAEEPLSAQFNVLQLSLLHTYEGSGEEMLPRIRRMVERYPAIIAWRLALASFLIESDRPEEARVEFEPLAGSSLERIPRDANWLVGITRLAEVAAALGHTESCRLLSDLLRDFSGEVVTVGRAAAVNGPVDHQLGLLSAALGELDAAVDHLRAAIAIDERMGERPMRAGTWLHLGRALLRRDAPGDRDAGLDALGHALELGQEMGMRRLVERAVRARLEAQGVETVSADASIDSVALAVADERPDLGSIADADGRVTILFSDIENSTLMTERLGDRRWIEVLRAHNEIFRRRLAEHRGYEVKSQGDGFMLAFGDPGAALACALAVQEDLADAARVPAGAEVRVRMGMHTGAVIEEEGDFFGRSVILAARIAAQARGGETLISEQVREAMRPDQFRCDEGRELELKGLAGSHRVYRVARAVAEDALPLEPASSRR